MMRYEELYDFLRKEKSNETLQKLPIDFVKIFAEFIHEHKRTITKNGDFFSDEIVREKKQYENSMTLFKELILRRKKKILNLVFVATETGVMKKDFDDMLSFEKTLFEQLLSIVDQTDKLIATLLLNGAYALQDVNILIVDDVEPFIGLNGESLGPYKKGDSVTMDRRVTDILVNGQKAIIV